jgi:hypothetical protein
VLYSSDPACARQVSAMLDGVSPDIIRRQTSTGRVQVQPSPEQLERDLRAVFAKHGGAMPVYRFVCDQADGGVMGRKLDGGDACVMVGRWSGKGVAEGPRRTPREVAGMVPSVAGRFDTGLPSGCSPETCMVFEDARASRGAAQRRLAADFKTAFCARFPGMKEIVRTDSYEENGRTVLVLDLACRGEYLPDRVKNEIFELAAEFGCAEPQEADGQTWQGFSEYRVYFYCEPSGPVQLRESVQDPAVVVVRPRGENERRYWLGCARAMQDLSKFGGDEVVRAFATDRHARAMGLREARNAVRPGSEIIAEGQAFGVRRVYVRDGALVAEAERRLLPGQAVCYFPADMAERLAGPCGLPRRDEEMFASWKGRVGGFRSYEILGESRWHDEPAFGEPRECVKVLLHLQ